MDVGQLEDEVTLVMDWHPAIGLQQTFTVNQVPEPSALLLLIVAAAGLFLMRRQEGQRCGR